MYLDDKKNKYIKHPKCYKNIDNERFYTTHDLADNIGQSRFIIKETIELLKIAPIKIVNGKKYINLYTYQSMLLIKKNIKNIANLRKKKLKKNNKYLESAFHKFASTTFMSKK